jgi:uncharacterized membrane protein YhaH (DUF805 family)
MRLKELRFSFKGRIGHQTWWLASLAVGVIAPLPVTFAATSISEFVMPAITPTARLASHKSGARCAL